MFHIFILPCQRRFRLQIVQRWHPDCIIWMAINTSSPGEANMCMSQWTRPSLVWMLACCLSGIIWFGDGLLLMQQFQRKFYQKYTFPFMKMHSKMSSTNWRPLCLGSILSTRTKEWPTNDSYRFRWKCCCMRQYTKPMIFAFGKWSITNGKYVDISRGNITKLLARLTTTHAILSLYKVSRHRVMYAHPLIPYRVAVMENTDT